jgi:hypothetical protein
VAEIGLAQQVNGFHPLLWGVGQGVVSLDTLRGGDDRIVTATTREPFDLLVNVAPKLF